MRYFDSLKPGDLVFVNDIEGAFRVVCRDERFIICTQSNYCHNKLKTFASFIIDLKMRRRGSDAMVETTYYTQEQCEERLKELQDGHISVSRKYSVPLRKKDFELTNIITRHKTSKPKPRVITYKELQNLPSSGISYVEIKKDTDIAMWYLHFPPGFRESFLYPEDYGTKWRVWEGKPTKAQREAEPWM